MTLGGTWYNELGSVMRLQVNNGAVTGQYETAVGGCAKGEFVLAGRTDAEPDSPNIGWSVSSTPGAPAATGAQAVHEPAPLCSSHPLHQCLPHSVR